MLFLSGFYYLLLWSEPMVAVLVKVGCIIVIIIVNEQIDSNKDESPSKLVGVRPCAKRIHL